MSSSSENAKHVTGSKKPENLLADLIRAVSGLTSAVSKGVIGTPINPGPAVDIKHGKGHPRR
ncbi:hypothetical protein DQ384_24215 [Sphaerisporangium album]|uniref:Uncharacterized protein n=1 Tax=Sphaerisporangium album TaxID=509200 RepID=A0A367FF51_9ACTN|nr:hypothetical protein [Sphaerisporangium album]RCG28240.1 hypothetical protein DQ384_24215 [Sphaerisporangium album]